jgi:hypothetical protein
MSPAASGEEEGADLLHRAASHAMAASGDSTTDRGTSSHNRHFREEGRVRRSSSAASATSGGEEGARLLHQFRQGAAHGQGVRIRVLAWDQGRVRERRSAPPVQTPAHPRKGEGGLEHRPSSASLVGWRYAVSPVLRDCSPARHRVVPLRRLATAASPQRRFAGDLGRAAMGRMGRGRQLGERERPAALGRSRDGEPCSVQRLAWRS